MDKAKNTLEILDDLKSQSDLPQEVTKKVLEAYDKVNELKAEKEKAELALESVKKKKEQAFILFQLDLFKRTNPDSRKSIN